MWQWLYSALLNTVGDLSLEELMAKYGYVSQEQGEDTCDSSDEDSECSLRVSSGLCCVCVCMRVYGLTPVYLQTHNKYRINNYIIIIIIITNTTVRIVIEGTSIAVGDPHTDT